MSNNKIIFVTVGTTKFEKLIRVTSSIEVLDIFQKLGYAKVVYQTGHGNYEEASHPKLKLEYHKYFTNFEEQIDKASLIISHGGAGTCLEVLRKKKPLIVVVNEDLMDNHQVELAEELANMGFIYYCTCDELHSVLSTKNVKHLRHYPEPNRDAFRTYLDKVVGFT